MLQDANRTLSGKRRAGPWGGPGGDWKAPHRSLSNCCTITLITNCYNNYAIRNFSYCYQYGNNGCVTRCGPWDQCNPCGERWNQQTICFRCGEYIIWVEGTYACCQGHLVITSLTFRTNCRTITIGRVCGTRFCYRVPCGKVVGFCCRAGIYLDAVDVYYA